MAASQPSAFLSYPYIPYVMVLIAVGFAYIHFSRNVRAKRYVLPVVLIVVGGIFGLLILTAPGPHPWQLFPIVIAVLVLNYLNIHFCPTCGTTVMGSLFRKVCFCSKCGASLRGDS
jgi:hypothetical protein